MSVTKSKYIIDATVLTNSVEILTTHSVKISMCTLYDSLSPCCSIIWIRFKFGTGSKGFVILKGTSLLIGNSCICVMCSVIPIHNGTPVRP